MQRHIPYIARLASIELEPKMANILSIFTRAFSVPTSPKPRQDGFSDDAARDVVAARSHGNLRLQWAQYYTRKEVDERYAKIKGFRFI